MDIPDWAVQGTMEHAQREALQNALKESRYQVSRAAAKLRIGRTTAYRLIKRFGINLPVARDKPAPVPIAPPAPQSSQQEQQSPAPSTEEEVVFDGKNYLLVKR